jgi:hypothetical protein
MTHQQRRTYHPDLTDQWTKNSMVFVVNCTPMRYVLKRVEEESGISHINLLLLDLEGSELTVLKTFDWKVLFEFYLKSIKCDYIHYLYVSFTPI